MSESQLRAAMCEVGRLLWQRGLIGATEGNLSCRLDPGRLLCTPGGACKGSLSPEELVVIDPEGRVAEGSGEPSSEIRLHLAAYRVRPDCQAFVHAHPAWATALTIAGLDLPDDVLPESAMVLGSVASVPFGFPGTDEAAAVFEPFLPGHKTFLLSHHGAAVLGKDLWDAYYRMETLERVARVVGTAKVLDRIRSMPAAAFERLQREALHGRLD